MNDDRPVELHECREGNWRDCPDPLVQEQEYGKYCVRRRRGTEQGMVVEIIGIRIGEEADGLERNRHLSRFAREESVEVMVHYLLLACSWVYSLKYLDGVYLDRQRFLASRVP